VVVADSLRRTSRREEATCRLHMMGRKKFDKLFLGHIILGLFGVGFWNRSTGYVYGGMISFEAHQYPGRLPHVRIYQHLGHLKDRFQAEADLCFTPAVHHPQPIYHPSPVSPFRRLCSLSTNLNIFPPPLFADLFVRRTLHRSLGVAR